MNYYQLLDDLDNPPNRWILGNINFDGEWDFWKYLKVGEVEIPKKKLFVSVREEGIPLDFTMADFELLIVSEKTASLMNQDEVQLIPVQIKEDTPKRNYYLMTIKNEIDCVDELNSVFDKWEINDPIRPDKAGQYKTFYKLFIKEELSDHFEIFRIKRYNSIIIVSENLKIEFEQNKLIGVKFKKVTGS